MRVNKKNNNTEYTSEKISDANSINKKDKNNRTSIESLTQDTFNEITKHLDANSAKNFSIALASSDKCTLKSIGMNRGEHLRKMMDATNALLQFCKQVVEQTGSQELKLRLNAIKKSESMPIKHIIIPGSEAVSATAKAERLIEEILSDPQVQQLDKIYVDKIALNLIEDYIPSLIEKTYQNDTVRLSTSTIPSDFIKSLTLLENASSKTLGLRKSSGASDKDKRPKFEIEMEGQTVLLSPFELHKKLEVLLNLIHSKLGKKEEAKNWTKVELDNLEKILDKLVIKYQNEIADSSFLSKLSLKISGQISSIKHSAKSAHSTINNLRKQKLESDYINSTLQDLSGSKGIEVLKELEKKYLKEHWEEGQLVSLFLNACEQQGEQAVKLILNSKILNKNNQIITLINAKNLSIEKDSSLILSKLIRERKLEVTHLLLNSGLKITSSNDEASIAELFHSLFTLPDNMGRLPLLKAIMKNAPYLILSKVQVPSTIDTQKPPLIVHAYKIGDFEFCKAMLAQDRSINKSTQAVLMAACEKRDFKAMKELFEMCGDILSTIPHTNAHPMAIAYGAYDFKMIEFFAEYKQTLNHPKAIGAMILNRDQRMLEIVKESGGSIVDGLEYVISVNQNDSYLHAVLTDNINEGNFSESKYNQKFLENLILKCNNYKQLNLIKFLLNKKEDLKLNTDSPWADEILHKLIDTENKKNLFIDWLLKQKELFKINLNKNYNTSSGILNNLENKMLKELKRGNQLPSASLLQLFEHQINIDFDKELKLEIYETEYSPDAGGVDYLVASKETSLMQLLKENPSFMQNLLKELKKQLKTLIKEQEEIELKFDYLTSSIKDYKDSLDNYNKFVEINKNSKKLISYEEYEEQYNKLTGETGKYSKNISIHQQMMHKIQEEIKDKEDWIEEYKKEVPGMRDQIKKANLERVINLKKTIGSLKNTLFELESNVQRLYQEQKSIESEISSLNVERNEFEKQLASKDNFIKKLTLYIEKIES
ncbi:MAG: hypothetical protein K0S74_377 [Chlamydiales bacterium]|jgi:hypothetical protein|nr:hypothetical protein [Chlamydiales bacterium]